MANNVNICRLLKGKTNNLRTNLKTDIILSIKYHSANMTAFPWTVSVVYKSTNMLIFCDISTLNFVYLSSTEVTTEPDLNVSHTSQVMNPKIKCLSATESWKGVFPTNL